ncbi:MAG: MFS transporter, partial [Myxococcales bacterium]|nr:MFS transporter [Myxococcales bacterium]
PDHAATDYTVQASVVVVAAGVAGALSGYLAKALGFVGHFTATTGLSLLGLLLVAWLLRRGAAPREVVP